VAHADNVSLADIRGQTLVAMIAPRGRFQSALGFVGKRQFLGIKGRRVCSSVVSQATRSASDSSCRFEAKFASIPEFHSRRLHGGTTPSDVQLSQVKVINLPGRSDSPTHGSSDPFQ